MNQYDVTAIGELLIDLTQNGISKQGNPVLEANPGGAPCNVLSFLTKMGHKVGFLGKVGRDGFGDQLEAALVEVGIDTRGLRRDDAVHTTLAVVHTKPDGDRDFSFYRKPGADVMLTAEELDEPMIRSSKLLHFGSLSMTEEPCSNATRRAIAIAEEAGILRSFDPNLREPLWDSLDAARQQILYGLAHCDILKISDNEILWLTGEDDYDAAVAWIQENYHIPLIFLTLGKDGSRAYCGSVRAQQPGFCVATVETTGAGDTFMGAMLHQILEMGWKCYSRQELESMLRFANAAAAIVTTRAGALRVMPSLEEIQTILSAHA